ncbi:MAG: VWA domain-containing protein [Anaerolineae bacterium]|nr:VWA domain-containing protein [Anaerolineae bacterium]
MFMYAPKRFLKIALLLLLTISALLPVTASAQVASSVQINYTEVEENTKENGLNLKVYFTLLDGAGKVIPAATPTNADITLVPEDGGGPIAAKVSKAEGPISLVLVLDTSGSMASQLFNMKQAAKTLVDKAPQNTRFTLIRFSSDIQSLVSFTEDKDRVKVAIDSLRAQGATCLFDAAYAGVESLIGTSQGRRAVIVFTDGRDEKTAGGGPCSTKTREEVVQKANDPNFNVPIYTIGFGRDNIDVESLTILAQQTRGVAAIGQNLQLLFGEIVDALNSQWQAEALVFPKAGQRLVTLGVKLTGNVIVQTPGTGYFISPKDFTIRPTATITPSATLPPLAISVDTVQKNDADKTISVSITVNEPSQVSEYRFDVIDANGILVKSLTVPAPISGPVSIPIGELPTGNYDVRVTAVTKSGQQVRSDTAKVGLVQTATPTPPASDTPVPTETTVPITVIIDSKRYEDDATKQALLVNLKFTGQERIHHLRVNLLNEAGIVVREYPNFEVQPVIALDLDNLPGGVSYTIDLTALSATDEVLFRTSDKFTHTLPTPTPLPTTTSTSTPVVPQIAISGIVDERDARQFAITVAVTNPQVIAQYQVRFVDAANVEYRKLLVDAPQGNRIVVDNTNFTPGKYTIEISGLDSAGQIIAQGTLTFEFNPPTPTPTVTATPRSLITDLTTGLQSEQQRPVILLVVAAVVLGLIALMFVVARRPKKPETGTPVLNQMTGAVDLRALKAQQDKKGQPRNTAQSAPPKPPQPPQQSQGGYGSGATERTAMVDVQGGYDADKTSPVAYATSALPRAHLTVENSREKPMIGRTVEIAHTPFTLGRRQRDLNFDSDDNVSREHAEITFKNGDYYITDFRSMHNTFIDDRQIEKGAAVRLYNGAAIRLGSTTLLRFTLEGSSTNLDIDATRPMSK